MVRRSGLSLIDLAYGLYSPIPASTSDLALPTSKERKLLLFLVGSWRSSDIFLDVFESRTYLVIAEGPAVAYYFNG